MSHIVKVKTQMKDGAIIEQACQQMGAQFQGRGVAQVYSTQREGLRVLLPGWKFPLVINEQTGEVHFDNYNGSWGSLAHLEKLTQTYTKLTALATLRRAGHRVIEQALPDGSVRLIAEVEQEA